MMRLSLDLPAESALKVLCLGCHSDDIEIGCGGTILRLSQQYSSCQLHWVVFSAAGEREEEARRGAECFAGSRLYDLRLEKFPDGFMPFAGADIKSVFEGLKRVAPDLILTHSRKDAHQDHRLIAELTWNTFRDHLILEYEIPKYDGDLGTPNLFVHLDEATCQRKVQRIVDMFQTQHNRHWFTADTFLALLRLRGVESAAPGGYAEAFYSRKTVLDTAPGA
jgi:LmbE family N-acetylglucosaminyl deacetylase